MGSDSTYDNLCRSRHRITTGPVNQLPIINKMKIQNNNWFSQTNNNLIINLCIMNHIKICLLTFSKVEQKYCSYNYIIKIFYLINIPFGTEALEL